MTVLEPIHLLFITTDGGAPAVTHPRVLVVAGRDSKATLMHSFEGVDANDAYFTNSVTEVVVGADAVLNMCRIQREGPASYHVATTQASLGRNATVTSTTLDLGGGFVRHDFNTNLGAAGAHVSLNGLYIGTGERHIDNHTFIDHAVPDTASDEVYKGILDDQAHGVFVGHVLVRPDSQRSDAKQVNKNLLLSIGAEIDTQPKLEIFADDVKCTHGAAVGQIDKDALFYLNSRGLDSPTALRLLVHGFVNEVLESIGDDTIRQYADQAVTTTLSKS
jgi:Fe-S cluster assembly protein SufD